ncbi:glycerate kinase [Desulfocastanea catecholica]
MRIIAAPNAFKGSLRAMDAAMAMKKGILAAMPDCHVVCVPVADGGDGLTEVLVEALAGTLIETTVLGPRLEPLSSLFCLAEAKGVAVIEMAKASGLALLPKNEQDPTKTSTYGTGQLIRAALDKGARRIIVGLGGSATCDGGIGMASALGYIFLDNKGTALVPIGSSLRLIHTIDGGKVDKRLKTVVVEGVCDVTNPLIGPNGASHVYSSQKGASPEQIIELDAGLENLARVIDRDMGIDIRHMAGAGAAGGLGGGLHAFLGAELRKGIDLVIDIVKLKEKIRGADLVLTAEGRIDFQTKYDKAPAGVARAAQEAGVPCIAVCGGVGERIDELYDVGIDAVFSICTGPQTLESAMQDGFNLLSHAVEQVVRTFLAGRQGR